MDGFQAELEKTEQLVSNLTVLKQLVSDPLLRGMVHKLCIDGNKADARAAKKKPSIPTPSTTADGSRSRSATPPPEPPAVPAAPAPEVDVVNSSTHRKEHARLARKMTGIDEATAPEMCKLWNGSRQDLFFFFQMCP